MQSNKIWENFQRGLKASVKGRKKVFTLSASALAFIFISLSNSPGYSLQMFSAGLEYWIPAVKARIIRTYLSGGLTTVLFNIIYSLAAGVTLTNVASQAQISGLKLGRASSIAPGFLVAGCAGCGVSLLGFLGVGGALAAMPFNGTGIKIGGLILLFYVISRTGDPKICSIDA